MPPSILWALKFVTSSSDIFLVLFAQKNWLWLQYMPLFIWRKVFLRSRSQFSADDFRVFYKTLDHLYNEQSPLSDSNTLFSSPLKQLSGHNPSNNHCCNTKPEVNDHHRHFQKSTLSQNRNLLTAGTEASTFRTFRGLFKVFWPRPQDLCILIKVTKKKGKMLEIRRVNNYNSILFFLSLTNRIRP